MHSLTVRFYLLGFSSVDGSEAQEIHSYASKASEENSQTFSFKYYKHIYRPGLSQSSSKNNLGHQKCSSQDIFGVRN